MAYEPPDRPGGGPRLEVALALLALAFLLMEGFQTYQLIRENDNLAKIRETQDPTIQEGQRVRKLLESLVSKTTQFAEAGDAKAKAVMDDLRRQGVSFKQSSPEVPAAPATPAAH
jgi:hypothetical protein